MPQMDSVTYLSQVTWFVVVFGLYYLVMVADVLPALDRALKMRVKKLALTRGDARQFDQERVQADEGYGRALASAAASSLGLLMACQDTQSAWAMQSVSELRESEGSERAIAHAECVEAMLETSASSSALSSMMDEVDLTEEEIREDESIDWVDQDDAS
jgi:F-type H+-transporting ATPase subunit b